jgi:hypothetical protein
MNEELNITSAQYVDVEGDGTNDHIDIVVDGVTMNVPLAPGNRHYAEIQRQVAAGTLTIQDAD